MKMQPLADRVIIKAFEPETTTDGGILIPDAAKGNPHEGEIIEVGPGRKTEDGKLISMEVKKGDEVLYGSYSGTTFHLDGQELLVMRESDILVVIGPSPPKPPVERETDFVA